MGKHCAVVVILGLIVSCGDVQDEAASAETETTEQAIWNGGNIDVEPWGAVGLPPGGCSGTLLRNDWVLTAGHCIELGLDRSVDEDGKVYYDVSTNSYDGAVAVATGANERIVVLGKSSQLGTFVLQFNADGTIDPTFGNDNNGMVLLEHPQDPQDLVIDDSGDIIVVGSTYLNGRKFSITKLHATGSMDLGFSGDGYRVPVMSSVQSSYANSVALDSNGDIVVGGFAYYGNGKSVFAAMRLLNGNGDLDATFHYDGKVLVDFGSSAHERALAIAVDHVGNKVVLAGWAHPSGEYGDGTRQMAVARLNSNGQLDTNFDTDGKAYINFPYESRGSAIALDQSSGSFIIGGDTRIPFAYGYDKGHFAAVKFKWNSGNPVLDTGFGVGGKVAFPVYYEHSAKVHDIALFDNDDILLVGSASKNSDLTDSSYASARIRWDDGSLDTENFGAPHGYVITRFATGKKNYGRSVAIGTDGKYIIAGSTSKSGSISDTRVSFAKYHQNHTEIPLLGNFEITMGTQKKEGAYGFQHPARDIALIKMESPFALNGSTSNHVRPIYAGSTASLDGQTGLCIGHGKGSPNGGYAYLKLLDYGDGHYRTGTNSQNQSQCQGDSGSSCLLYNYSTGSYQLVGVLNSGQHCDGGPSAFMQSNGAENFKSWADSIISNN